MYKESLVIKKASIDDKDIIKNLWQETLSDVFNYDKTIHHNVEDELNFKMQQFDETCLKAKGSYYLAFLNNELIGTIAYTTTPNVGILKRTGKDLINTYEVGSLYIKPKYQNMGYGKDLLIFMYRYLESKGVLTICFDTIIESSKKRWLKMFGEPKYKIFSNTHEFMHMVWVINVKEVLKKLENKG